MNWLYSIHQNQKAKYESSGRGGSVKTLAYGDFHGACTTPSAIPNATVRNAPRVAPIAIPNAAFNVNSLDDVRATSTDVARYAHWQLAKNRVMTMTCGCKTWCDSTKYPRKLSSATKVNRTDGVDNGQRVPHQEGGAQLSLP
jgi:hypothetical protein